MPQFDPQDLRNALASYMTGVTVVTTHSPDGNLVGFTANSFTSVSLNPPLLLVCPGNHLSSFDIFAQATHFAVNILAEGQEATSNIFASSKEDRFSLVKWQADKFGNPLLEGAAAHFSCSLHNRVEAGDHQILIGQIEAFSSTQQKGLGYCRDGYFSLSKERQSEATAQEGQKFLASALVEYQDQLLALRHADGLHIPTVQFDDRSGARSALTEHLRHLGLNSKIGPVYSVFEDAERGEHVTVFRASLLEEPCVAEVELWPISDLDPADLQPPANADMLRRFREEHANNQFGLYIGDAKRGEIHPTAPPIDPTSGLALQE